MDLLHEFDGLEIYALTEAEANQIVEDIMTHERMLRYAQRAKRAIALGNTNRAVIWTMRAVREAHKFLSSCPPSFDNDNNS